MGTLSQSSPSVEERLTRLPNSGDLPEALRYGVKRRERLSRFLDDGRLEMDTNTVERAMRPIALNRKNTLVAGSDEGGTAWGALASLVETCKLNGVEPHAYFTDVLTKIVQGWPAARLDDLLAWACVSWSRRFHPTPLLTSSTDRRFGRTSLKRRSLSEWTGYAAKSAFPKLADARPLNPRKRHT
jgi:hypothetical protein